MVNWLIKKKEFMIKKIIHCGILMVFGFFLTACSVQKESSQVQSGLKVVTSFYTIYSLIKEVSGERNDVRMIGSRQGDSFL